MICLSIIHLLSTYCVPDTGQSKTWSQGVQSLGRGLDRWAGGPRTVERELGLGQLWREGLWKHSEPPHSPGEGQRRLMTPRHFQLKILNLYLSLGPKIQRNWGGGLLVKLQF